MPIMAWLHYADHALDPIRRSLIGSNVPIADSQHGLMLQTKNWMHNIRMEQSNQRPPTTCEIASKLALSANNTSLEVELALRTIGYLDIVPDLNTTLERASALRSRFVVLQKTFPNLKEIISRFILAADLSSHLSKLQFTGGDIFENRRRNKTLEGLEEDPLLRFDIFPTSEPWNDLISLGWLCEALRVSENVDLKSPTRLDLLNPLCLMDHYPNDNLQVIQRGFERVGFRPWLDAISLYVSQTDLSVFSNLAAIATIADSLSALNPIANSIPHCPSPKPPVIQIEHRSLTNLHWNALKPSELKSIQQALENRERPHESLVIELGLATGRSIRDTLNLRLVGHHANLSYPEEQHVRMQLLPGFAGKRYRATWVIPLNRGRPLVLPLPEHFTDHLRRLIGPETDTRLINRLPITHQSWESRCNTELTRILNAGRLRSNLILRDSLGQACYAASSNAAIGYWLNSGRNRAEEPVRSDQVALSYYLDPGNQQTVRTYQKACQSLFGKYGRYENAISSANSNFGVKIETHCRAADIMRERLESATKSDDLIRLHNAFTQYSLLLLIVATAHRKSTTPFFFPWDLALEEQVAFIADKCVTGSEARVVPLAKAAVSQTSAYLHHLKQLHQRLGSDYAVVKKHIAALIDVVKEKRSTSSDISCLSAGLFFEIFSDGAIRTISTWQLSQLLTAAGIPVGIGDFRKSLADALWGMEFSGMEIAALLGHANDLHVFGPASSWSLQQVADRLRPSIDDYLSKRRWFHVDSPIVHKRCNCMPPPSIRIPTRQPGDFSYEGRRKMRVSAEKRASLAVRAVLSDDFLEDHNYSIDDDLLQSIHDDIDERLDSDAEAKKSVTAMLAAAMQKLRRRGITVNSFLPNRYRFEPSPIELTFGRHLAIAKVFRTQWITRVGLPIGGTFDTLERIAQLAINLVVLDGVLNPKRLEGVITALLEGNGIAKYPDALTIRSHIETRDYKYEWRVIAGDISTALALGLDANSGANNSELNISGITKRVGVICTKLMGRSIAEKASWTLERLTSAFKPWWFLRQTGAMYSIATGRHNGPAENVSSESSLLAISEPEPMQAADFRPPDLTPEASVPLAFEAAWREIRRLLSESAGRLEEGTAHSRVQRQKLKKSLQDGIQGDLSYWKQEQPIIDFLLTFSKSLLVSGGLRLKTLRFSSIHTYLNTIALALIRHGWDRNFMEMTVADYRDLYANVESDCKQKSTDWRLVLRMFHQHIRDTIGAPYLPEMAFSNTRMQKKCRGFLITSGAIDAAEKLLTGSRRLDSDQKKAARTLMLTSVGYGTRLSECAGIKAGDFDVLDERHLTVRANVIRDIKNRKRGRIIPGALLNATQHRAITSQRRAASLSPDAEHFLLGSPERRQEIISISPLTKAITTAIRTASGSDAAVFHDFRHTFATRLILTGHPLQSKDPALLRMLERLLGTEPSDSESIRQITRTSPGNPFFVDDAAQLLGHANPDTLLNVYFHGASVLLADTAIVANRDIHIDDQRLANMLGKDRTALVKLRSRRVKSLKATDTGSLVRYYLEKNCSTLPTTKVTRSEDGHKFQHAAVENKFSPNMLDRLLCRRKTFGLSLVELADLAMQTEIPTESVEKVFLRYRELVCNSGFDDFEPDNSELLSRPPERSAGVLRGRQEREAVLHQIADLLRRNERCSESCRATLQAWGASIDGSKPMLVIRDIERLKHALHFLGSLGTKDEQLTFSCIGGVQSPLLAELNKRGLQTSLASGRFSRGPKNVQIEEIGISVSQLAGSTVPDGRDFHRVMAIAWCSLL